jgi:hypothetical protein
LAPEVQSAARDLPVSADDKFVTKIMRVVKRIRRLFLTSLATLVLVCSATVQAQEKKLAQLPELTAVMATINGQDEYKLSGRTGCYGEAMAATIKPGELFIARKLPYYKDWEVNLKSGVDGLLPPTRIRVLPNEPLMKLNYDECKKEWHKRQFKTATGNEEASAARAHGINYFKLLSEASEGDLKAMAKFFSLYRYMDGGAAEGYYPETWALLHVVGDETFAKFLRAEPLQDRQRISGTFSEPGDTEPISDPKPYIKRHFPKTHAILYGK